MDDEQERLLPIANVGRIMKQILPATAKISKESKQTMQECATEFISFVTAEASDKCHKENRKTVNGDDICWALSTLGFDNYAEAIVRYLYKYREAERQKANQNKGINSSQDKQLEESNYRNDQLGKQTHEAPAPLEFRAIDETGDHSQAEAPS
ncbi:nuclear transcription factor Y subunit B-4-like [Juglans microcarpa x Juglans regia]|uniref:nuclear transcription factor Y subunit B-4-like n=1 Tax=Juglans microcarpa x Juglans regia TaxID=2249226 RepID=UPI001B7EDB93|nr:nuclear transcription factor Y subunit B-4-like [Juglans microcarpa x Juglans regia]